MKRSLIRLSVRAIALVLGLVVYSNAWAVDPVAVWDGDFTTMTKGAYTLSENGNTKTDTYLQISGSQGVLVTGPNDVNTFTVIVRCSGLNLSSESTQVLFTSKETGPNNTRDNLTGVILPANNAACRGMWNGGAWDPDSGTAGYSSFVQNLVPAKYTTIIYNHQQTNGTYAYALGPTSDVDDTVLRTTLYSIQGLRSSGSTYSGCAIGGLRGTTSTTLLPATGLKITSIAVFSGTLTEAEMKSYVWPSDVTQIDVSESKCWSQLNVPAGAKNIALNITGNATVTIDENVSLDGLSVVSTDSELTLNVEQGITASIGGYDCSKALGRVTLNISQGSASVSAGSDTVLNGLGTGAISISAGKRLTISESGMKKSQLTNNGTLRIVGGNETTPIEIYDNGAANTGMGVITLAANAYVRNNATNGNKLYTITGASDGSSTLVLSSGQNWGMTNGTAIRNCKVLVRNKNFWWERASAFDKTVDLDYGTITLHIGNPDSKFEIGSFTGSGSISRDNSDDTLTINADRIDGVFSYALSNIPLTVKGSHVQLITAATGSIIVDGGVVQLGSQTVTSLQNGGTVKYTYSAKPTVSSYSGSGVFVVDMTGTTPVAGTQYSVVEIAGVTADKVSVVGFNDDSFELYTVAAGVVLADESLSSAIWTGDSGVWSASTFDGKAIETDGVPVAFADAKSGAESVTVTLDGPKTVEAANFTANTTAYELTGGTLTGPISLAGTAPVTLKTAPVIGNGGLSGTGPLVLDFGPNSVFTMSTDNTAYNGEATIASGTVKMGNAKSFGNFARSAAIRVKSGATLDANGASNGGDTGSNNKIILEAGSSFSNSASLNDTKFFAFYDMTVEGNATIVADTANNGLAKHWNYGTYVHVGDNTLTKTGNNTFYMSAPTIDGTGTIDVSEGVLSLTHSYYNVQPTFANGTIMVRSGAQLALQNYNSSGTDLTVKKIIVEGTGIISGRGSATATDGVELRTVSNKVTEYPTLLTAATSVSATGNGTLAFGEGRPSNTVSIGENVGISVKMQNSADSVIKLKLNRNPASVTVYDESGSVCANSDSSYDADSGELTVFTTFRIEAASGTIAFDNDSSWAGGTKPSADDSIIIITTGDATLSVGGAYSLDTVLVTGGGTVSFSGSGSITASNVTIKNGVTFTCNANITATTGISLDSGTVLKLDGVTENAAISGAGAVETYGNVEFTAENTFTGGLTVKSGSLVSCTKTVAGGQVFGKNNYGQAIANLSRIVVEDGGSLDLANTTDACYAITISGKGVYDSQSSVYKGALYNSGPEIGQNSRQTASLTLAADAMVRAESSNNGWGIVNSSHDASVLALNGHTLTVSGAGYFPIVNANTASGTQTTGTLIADGVTLGLVSTASNLTGVDVIAKGCATIKLETAPSALGSLTLKPSATGTTASNWNLPSGCVPTLDTSNVDPAGLSVGDTLTLFTAPQATTLTAETIAVKAGGRYTTTISGNTVTATVKALAPFLHYDFNGEASAAGAKASDSTYAISGLGGNWPATNVNGRNGTAALIKNGNTPFWNSLSANVSAIHAGEMSVVALIRPIAIDGTVRTIWNLGQAGGDGMALVAKNASTLALVSWTGGGAGADIVSVSNIQELAGKWHFVAVVASASGTTLVVDGNEVSTTTCVPQGMTQAGQFGAVHGNGSSKGYYGASDDGFRLDDWRVYDVALTAEEVASIKKQLLPGTIFMVY